ncbi:MAG: CmcI family methyltransferase [Candidatus Abyssubacteria bacterium]
MKLTIDTDARVLIQEYNGKREEFGLYCSEAFELLSLLWLKVGWNLKYTYTFTWMGRPIIQLPEDMIRAQEVIYRVRPNVIIETGIAHGGSLIYYASLCRLMGRGRVIGVDVEIREHNRKALQAHEMIDLITLIEGDSIEPSTIRKVYSLIAPGESALVILDSCHSKEHVLAELEAYSGLVTPGSYIIATDGIMKDLYDVPRGDAKWTSDNPSFAAKEFIAEHPEFVMEEPAWVFNESSLRRNVTYWPSAWLRKL